jgi:multidrug resistance efflux pump
VTAGEVIAVLYDFDKERELSLISGELEQKRAELSLLIAGPRLEEIDQAERLVATKQVELANVRRNLQQRNQLEQTLARERTELRLAQIEFDRTRELFEAGLGPRVDMDKAETQLEIQQGVVAETEASLAILAEANDREEDLKLRELAQAQSALNLLMAGFRSEEIQQRQAEVEALESQQKILQQELEKGLIAAPISGTVVTPLVEQLLNEHLQPGDELFRIVDADRVSAELQVPEKEMSDVSPGSRVVLKVRSYPSRDFEGRVDFIAPVAETIEGQRFVKVRTELPNQDGALKSDMTGVAKIHAGRRLVIQLMTRRLIRWIRTEFWDLLP